MSSEFIILHSAKWIARSRGHDSGPASAHVRTPRLIASKIYAKNIFQLYKYSVVKPIYISLRSDENRRWGGGRYLKIERRDGRHLGEVFERRAKFQHRRKQVENVEEWVFRDSGGRVKGGWNLILKNIRLGCIYLLSAMKRECECFRNWK